jgi:hypothetical protein
METSVGSGLVVVTGDTAVVATVTGPVVLAGVMLL